MGDKIQWVLLGAIVLLTFAAFAVLSFQPPTVLQHFATVASAITPLATFFTVLVAVLGLEEARRTEREKRESANLAHRGLMRARLLRVWGIISDAVDIFKPYNSDTVERFVVEAEEVYWDKESFSAFDRNKQTVIRDALDCVRQDNFIAHEWMKTRKDEGNLRDFISECFLTSLGALAKVFREVFHDDEIACDIEDRRRDTRERVERLHARAIRGI